MQSSLRLASSNCFRSRVPLTRQVSELSNGAKQGRIHPSVITSCQSLVSSNRIHTSSSEGPLCQAESVKTQLKRVSNVDTPETIRQAWFHPEFPVEKMTALLVSINCIEKHLGLKSLSVK